MSDSDKPGQAAKWRSVKEHFGAITTIVSEDEIDLNNLMEEFAGATKAIADAFTKTGYWSVRLGAAAKVFDPETPKSVLEAFVAED